MEDERIVQHYFDVMKNLEKVLIEGVEVEYTEDGYNLTITIQGNDFILKK